MDKELDVLLRTYQNVAAEVEAVQAVVGPRQYERLRELAAQIDGYVNSMLIDKMAYIDTVMQIPREDFRMVLLLRDIAGLRFSEVATEMNLSIRHVFRLYKAAREEQNSATPFVKP